MGQTCYAVDRIQTGALFIHIKVDPADALASSVPDPKIMLAAHPIEL